MLVFIAQKKNLPEVTLRILLHDRHAIEDGPLEIEFQHHAEGFGQARIHRDREVQTAQRRGKAPVRPRRQGRRVGVDRSEAESLDGRSGRIRRSI